MDSTRHVFRGEQFPSASETVNGWQEAAKYVKQRLGGTAGVDRRPPGPSHATHVRVKNDSGEDWPAFACIKLTGSVVSPLDDDGEYIEGLKFTSSPVLLAQSPSDPRDLPLITIEPIKADAIGLAVVTGVAVVDLDLTLPIGLGSSKLFAVATPGSVVMTAYTRGPARILAQGIDDGTGLVRAVVLLGGSDSDPAWDWQTIQDGAIVFRSVTGSIATGPIFPPSDETVALPDLIPPSPPSL